MFQSPYTSNNLENDDGGNVTKCPTFQVLNEHKGTENGTGNKNIIKTISKKEKSIENDFKDGTGCPIDVEYFETGEESSKDLQDSFMQLEGENLVHLNTTTSVIHNKSIINESLSQYHRIEQNSPSRLWLNFPLQIGLELEKYNNENTVYRIKSLSPDNDCFDYDSLFHGRENSNHKKTDQPTEIISPTSQRTPEKFNPAIKWYFPFKPPIQTYGYSTELPITGSKVEYYKSTTQKMPKNNAKKFDHQSTTPLKQESDNQVDISTKPHEKTKTSLITRYFPDFKQVNGGEIIQQKPPFSNVDLNNFDYFTLPTTNYPHIDHRGVISKFKKFFQKQFGKHITPPPFYSGSDLENFLTNYDLSSNLNGSLPFPSIEAITLPQTGEKFYKKSKLEQFIGRMFGTSTETQNESKSELLA